MAAEGRPIPGTVPVAGRKFLYIEHADESTFVTLFNEIGEFIEQELRPPPSGGMITTNALIVLPSRSSFCGVSFKGDLQRWEEGITRFAERRGLQIARIEGSTVVTSARQKYPLDLCSTRFFDLK